jgi:hypothetical protein
VLKLDRTYFSSELNGLLKDFPNLHELSAQHCDLKRLPDSIGAMHRLERLQLSDNQIVFDANAVLRLKKLTFLEILRLEGNPLAMAPDIGRMPRLKVVALKNTGLTSWPDGVLAKTRPRGFFLDLRDNPLSVIPEVVPGRPEAWVIARTRLNVGDLSEMNQLRYQEIRRSVELPPEPLVTAHPTDYGTTADNWADVQQPRTLQAVCRHDQTRGAGHQAIARRAVCLVLQGNFPGLAIGVVDDFENVDLDESGAVATVEYTLQISTFIASQIVVNNADIDLRPGQSGMGEQRKTKQCQQTFHDASPQ